MKLGCLRVTTILILSVAAIASADTAAGRVAAVIDGDDIELCTGSACTRIRLCGIDAPEAIANRREIAALVRTMNVLARSAGEGD